MRKNLPGKTMKKRGLVLLLACIAALALMVPALAHGHGGGHHQETHHNENHVQLCALEGCWLTGTHTHNGVAYCGNHHAEGYCAGNCAVSSTFVMHHHGTAWQGSHGSHHH